MKMMRKAMYTALSLFAVGMLSACTGTENKAEAIKAIEEAAQNNRQLMNAKFDLTTEVSVDGENVFFLQSAGAFLQNGKGAYDWHMVDYAPGTERIPQRELVEVDESQMVRVTISSTDRTEWSPIEKPALSLESLMGDLFEPDIPVEHIDEVTLTESSAGKIYRVSVDKSYMEEYNAETITQFEAMVEDLKELDQEPALIESYEEQITKLETTEYSNYVQLYEVNEQGFLKSVTVTGTTKFDDETQTTIRTYRLTDLDSADTSGWIPETE